MRGTKTIRAHQDAPQHKQAHGGPENIIEVLKASENRAAIATEAEVRFGNQVLGYHKMSSVCLGSLYIADKN